MKWETEKETVEFQSAAGFGPKHSLEWEARIDFCSETDTYSWYVHNYRPFEAYAEGFEKFEDKAKAAVVSQLARWDLRFTAELETGEAKDPLKALYKLERCFASWDGPILEKASCMANIGKMIENLENIRQ